MKPFANWFLLHPKCNLHHLITRNGAISLCREQKYTSKAVPSSFTPAKKFARNAYCSKCEALLPSVTIDPGMWYPKTAKLFYRHDIQPDFQEIGPSIYVIPWQDLHQLLLREQIYEEFKKLYGYMRLVHFDGLDAGLIEETLTKLNY